MRISPWRWPKSTIPPITMCRTCAPSWVPSFPGVIFYTLPVDMVTQILNFGLPAPIDIQVIGQNLQGNREFIDRLLRDIIYVPGTADLAHPAAFQ